MKPQSRRKEAYERYINGESYISIAKDFEVSPVRVRQLAIAHQDSLERNGIYIPVCTSCGRTKLEHKPYAHEFIEKQK